MLEFNQYMKSDKTPYIIYADTESLIRKIDRCANNPEKSSKTKIGQHIPCEYSMSTIWSFDNIENKHTLHHGKDCIKTFWTSLREHTKNIIDFNGQFECLGENTEKFKTFSVPIAKKVTKIYKDGNKSVETISDKIKIIDSTRFMAVSSPNLVDNFAEGIHKIKWKNCDCFLEYESVKDTLIKYKCFSCIKDHLNKLAKNLRTHLSLLKTISVKLFCC